MTLLIIRSSTPRLSSFWPAARAIKSFREALRERNLTHIYVDWEQIERHRKPGGYGFTDFVQRPRFDRWVAAGVLDRPLYFHDHAMAARYSWTSRQSRAVPGQVTFRVSNTHLFHSRGRLMDDLTVVTGGAGFIGSHLVEQLVDSGQQVRVIERPGADVDHLPAAVDVFFADIRDRRALARAMEGARWVYHLAANPNLWVRDRREFDAVNYQGTINVLDAAARGRRRRVLHTSTESILTKAKVDGPDRREYRDSTERCGRPVLPVEAAGRAIRVFSGGQGFAGCGGQSRRCRLGRAIAGFRRPRS